MPAWLIALFSILIAGAFVCIVVLFVLRSKDKKSQNVLIGMQGPRGEMGFDGLSGAQGFQGPAGSSVGTSNPNFKIVKCGFHDVAPFAITPSSSGTFFTSLRILYEISSERISSTTVRHSVVLRSRNILFTPYPDPPGNATQLFAFGFQLPTTIIPLNPVFGRETFMGTTIVSHEASVAPIGLLNNVFHINDTFNVFYSTGNPLVKFPTNTEYQSNFQITFLSDETLAE